MNLKVWEPEEAFFPEKHVSIFLKNSFTEPGCEKFTTVCHVSLFLVFLHRGRKINRTKDVIFRPKLLTCVYVFNRYSLKCRSKIGNTKKLSRSCGTQFRPSSWFILPIVQNYFNKTQQISLKSFSLCFFLKTFLTVIANLLNSGNNERRFDKNRQDRKSLVFLKPLLVANLFWIESSKTFLSHQYNSFIKSQLAFKFQKVKTIEDAFFQKTRFHFFKRHLHQYSEVQKNPVFAGRLVFLLNLQHERKIFFSTICNFFTRNLPSVSGFETMSVHIWKKSWKS